MSQDLTPKELARYNRHLILPEVGPEGQAKLKAAKVLIVGAGGLGCPIALYLAAAGVGRLGLVDFDRVDESNLQRQVLYTTSDIGKPKVEAAKARLLALNPHVQIDTYDTPLSSQNALEIFEPYDLVVDGTDNFQTRYLVNDACVLSGKINVYGSIFRFEGQVSVFGAKDGPCYRCLYPEPPPPGLVPSCAEGGVLGVLPGTVGSLQATECLKLIAGFGQPLIGRLLRFDASAMKFYELRVRKDAECPICGPNPSISHLIDYDQFCGVTPQQPKDSNVSQRIPAAPGVMGEIGVTELKQLLDTRPKSFTLLDVREPHEVAIAAIPGAVLIPMRTVADRLSELDPQGEIIVHCHHGGRSARIAELLIDKGFANVSNLVGGIHEWSLQVDPKVPTY